VSTPYDDLVAWFNATPGADAYTRARGTWVDSPANDAKRFAVFQFQGGPKPDVDRYTATVDVLLLGKKGERNVAGALPDIENFAYSLLERSIQLNCSGRITQIRCIGGVTGPGYTAEDRPWYRLAFSLDGIDIS
jgi:hypothetical protein